MQFMASSPDMAAKLAGLDKLRVMNAAAYEKEIPMYSQAVAACASANTTAAGTGPALATPPKAPVIGEVHTPSDPARVRAAARPPGRAVEKVTRVLFWARAWNRWKSALTNRLSTSSPASDAQVMAAST